MQSFDSHLRPAALIAFFLLLGSATLAARPLPDKLTLRAETLDEGTKLQQALVFEKDRVVFVANSNFLCGHQSSARLGVWEAPYDTELSNARELARLSYERQPKTPFSRKPRSESVRLFLGKIEYGPTDPRASMLRQTLVQACQYKAWKARQGAEVSVTGASAPQLEVFAGSGSPSHGELKCKGGGSSWSCRVPAFGQVSLTSP